MMKNADIKIRPFRREDFDQVNGVLTEAFSGKIGSLLDTDCSEAAELMLETGFFCRNPVDGYFVAETEGNIAGVILLKFPGQMREDSDFRLMPVFRRYGLVRALKFAAGALLLEESAKAGECYIEYIAVNTDFRGLGIGSALLEYAMNYAAGKGFSWLTLCAASSNPAINLYLRSGFIQKKEIRSLLTYLFFGLDKWIYMAKSTDKQS
ncbi:GCN5-related N-acetyltransferase [Methanolacinia petrolearia DSM 11571]|uniref:GCN5-related N-acetyltransferase n=1 Tax=Methanolacinia petrolearia (strain DSM 11571 / OCM 486 / SEBR 4847) TaxID=679926 RepID=E1RKK0_METP4|nr:GNAT family N-acetyltransferase [Methanolacinia petrolearia]ADN35853.1 GCN5-related N-acetyltransferase [Methanolacinia petrolearia DSM 11571]